METRRFIVRPGSEHIGRRDPVTGLTIQQGNEVVDCGRGHLYLIQSWQSLRGRCPLCHHRDAAQTVQQARLVPRSLARSMSAHRRAPKLPSTLQPVLAIGLLGVCLLLVAISAWVASLFVQGRVPAGALSTSPEVATIPSTDQPSPSPPMAAVTFVTATPVIYPTSTFDVEVIVHVVRQGETLTTIAALYGLTPDVLQAFNGLTDPDAIYVDQQLLIPVGGDIEGAIASLPTFTPSPTLVLPDSIQATNPLAPYTIPALRARTYNGGRLVKEARTFSNSAYEQWQISYYSDDIYVTGLMDLPHGQGPWPVIIVLHGGVDQDSYEQGWGTSEHCEFFARHGYLCLMPDYRSYNHTQGSGSPLKIPWAIDVMNLIAALPTLPEADSARVGVLGHSRGGGIATYIMVLAPQVRAVSLYAPLHTDQAVNWDIYANTFGADWPILDAEVYGSPTSNPEGYRQVSPGTYLDWVAMPVIIHHGSADATIPVQWSRDLYNRLQQHGVTVEYYEYPGAGHTLIGEDYDLFLQRNLEFFDIFVRP